MEKLRIFFQILNNLMSLTVGRLFCGPTYKKYLLFSTLKWQTIKWISSRANHISLSLVFERLKTKVFIKMNLVGGWYCEPQC